MKERERESLECNEEKGIKIEAKKRKMKKKDTENKIK